jgi:hypothetical protein
MPVMPKQAWVVAMYETPEACGWRTIDLGD